MFAAAPRLTLVVALLVPAAAGPQAAPEFQLLAVDGSTSSGTLQRLDADGAVQIGSAKSAKVELRRWLTLRRAKKSLPSFPSGPQIVFANGDRVPIAADAAIRLLQNRLSFQPLLPLL